MYLPLVSIIIPTFNRSHLICEALDSILAQTYENWECIIVDDGSTDDTEMVVRKYVKKDARFQFHKRPTERLKGGNAARNFGFEVSNGEYINWFDDDDVMLEDFIKIKISLLTQSTELVISSGYYVDEKLENRKAIILNEQANLFKDYILWKLQILTPSVLFKKSFLKDKELFSPTIKRGQETEFFSRLLFRVPKESYQIVNKPLFLYRLHQNTKSSKDLVYINENQKGVSFIYKSNLARGIILKDKEIIVRFYARFISLWFRSLDYKDFENMNLIKQYLKEILLINNKIVYFNVRLIFTFCSIFQVNSSKLRKYLKTLNINE